MSTVQQIADQLRAANFEHVRAIIEPDDNMVLIDYLESQGFVSEQARLAKEAAAAEAKVAKEEPPISEVFESADGTSIEITKPEAVDATPEDEGPKQGKLPEDFPGRVALGEANINTFAQARKQRDSKDGLTGVPGIGAATATKIEEALA